MNKVKILNRFEDCSSQVEIEIIDENFDGGYQLGINNEGELIIVNPSFVCPDTVGYRSDMNTFFPTDAL